MWINVCKIDFERISFVKLNLLKLILKWDSLCLKWMNLDFWNKVYFLFNTKATYSYFNSINLDVYMCISSWRCIICFCFYFPIEVMNHIDWLIMYVVYFYSEIYVCMRVGRCVYLIVKMHREIYVCMLVNLLL